MSVRRGTHEFIEIFPRSHLRQCRRSRSHESQPYQNFKLPSLGRKRHFKAYARKNGKQNDHRQSVTDPCIGRACRKNEQKKRPRRQAPLHKAISSPAEGDG